MPKFLEISFPIELEDGVMALTIKNSPILPAKVYKYRCHKDPIKSKELFWSYWWSFQRNKGRFLNKIRRFQIDNSI